MSLQYYRNQLELVTLDDGTMQQVLYKLQGAVKRATGILKEKVPGSLPENTIAPGTIYSGILGMCLYDLIIAQEVAGVQLCQ